MQLDRQLSGRTSIYNKTLHKHRAFIANKSIKYGINLKIPSWNTAYVNIKMEWCSNFLLLLLQHWSMGERKINTVSACMLEEKSWNKEITNLITTTMTKSYCAIIWSVWDTEHMFKNTHLYFYLWVFKYASNRFYLHTSQEHCSWKKMPGKRLKSGNN